MKFDIIGFGALNVDKLYNVNKITHEDEEAFITDYKRFCGGSAANTIIGISRLGMKTGFIGKVADDLDGNLLVKNLKNEDVNTDGIIIGKKGRSGNVIGFVDKKGQRALYVDPGVNDLIKVNEINMDYVSNSKMIHLTSFVGDSIKAQEHILNEITDDLIVSLDPGRIYAEKGIDFLKNILYSTDIILINEEELKHLTGNKNISCHEGADALLDIGINIVVIKRGHEGCYITDGRESYLVSPFQVNCIDTTGAGDAFNAGFLYGFSKGKSIQNSAQLGNLVASHCIKESGAITGLPQLNDLKNY